MPRAGLDTEAVVAAAAGLADDVGLERLTLAGLAAALGIRTPSLYAHVDGLPDLRARMGARGARELATQLQLAAAGRSGADALRAVAGAYRAYAHAHPGRYAAMQAASEREENQAAGAAVVGVILAVLERLRAGRRRRHPRRPGGAVGAARVRGAGARGRLWAPALPRRQLRHTGGDD